MLITKLRIFLGEEETYFKLDKNDIVSQNRRMLEYGCILYALVLIFYTIMTCIMSSSVLYRNLYFIYDAIHLLLCAVVFLCPASKKQSPILTQSLCAVLELSILSFFVIEAVYVAKTQHSLYIPIAILLIILLFTHRTWYISVMLVLYTGSYALLSVYNKAYEVYINDIYVACASLFSAAIGFMLVSILRHDRATAMRNYKMLSRTDMLTGLLNKAAIDELCIELFENKEEFYFMIIDIDDFKGINDKFGHDIGDEVLSSIGKIFGRCFRPSDSVGRFGGDEFIAIIRGTKDIDEVSGFAVKVLEELAGTSFTNENIELHCSAGVTKYRADEDSIQTVFKRGDLALYQAKKAGKNRYVVI